MRRLATPALILFVLSLGVSALRPAKNAVASILAAGSSPALATDDTAQKKSDAGKKDSVSKDEKKTDKDAGKAKQTDAEKAEKKDAKKPADAKEKDKAKKSEEKPSASDNKKPAAKPEEKKRKTYKVDAKRLKVVVPLDGAIVAKKMEEVAIRPKSWSDYEIVEVVEHGAKVHKGERLFKFDDEKINDAIQDLELEQRINDLAIMRGEEELPRLEKSLKMDLEDAERTDKNAKEDLKRYNDIDRPEAIKSAEFMVKYYNFMLDYEKDELHELEKMYKADDLTEETEEIVLKRQRNQVEFAEFSLAEAKIEADEMINVRIPRMDIRMKEMVERAALNKSRAQMALSLDLDRARYELEQRKNMRTKSLDRHTKLLGDKELMEIKSPADGIVYYGQCTNGRWPEMSSLIQRYKPHNTVSGNSVLMTIVETRPLSVTSFIDETKRPEVSDGQKVKVTLPLEGSNHVSGDVKSISPIPVSPGKFEIKFGLNQDEIPDWVLPGMNCKVQITTYDKADALVIPKKAVHDDKDDPDQHYVWLVDPDDADAKPERRNVKLGKRKDDEVEVLKGLKKGNVISLEDEGDKDTEKDQPKPQSQQSKDESDRDE